MKIRKHPNYLKKNPLWNFYMKTYLGGNDYIVGSGMLYSHKFEYSEDYKQREGRAYYLNFTKPIVDCYVKYVHGERLNRVAVVGKEEQYKRFETNCDGTGTDLDLFMKKVGTLTKVYGKVGVLVNGPDPALVPVIQTVESVKELIPSLRVILPTDLLDWSLDNKGEYNWIFFTYKIYLDEGFLTPRREATRFEVWNREAWAVYEKKKDSTDTEDLMLISTGTHALGVVPFVLFTHTNSQITEEPEGLVDDISILNRTVFNYCSLLDEILYGQAFAQLVVAGEDTEINKKVMGVNRYFNYPPNSPYPPAFISPDASQAKLILEVIHDSIAEMYHLATLPSKKNTDNYNTALGKVIDFEDTQSALVSVAKITEEGEEKLSRITGLWYALPDGLWIATYPKTFDIRSFTQQISDALSLLELRMGKTFEAEMKKVIARQGLPQANSETHNKIDEEIDAMEPIEIIPAGAKVVDEITPGVGNPPDSGSAKTQDASKKGNA